MCVSAALSTIRRCGRLCPRGGNATRHSFLAWPLVVAVGRVVMGATDLGWPGNYFPSPLSGAQNLRVAKPWKCRLRLHDWDDRENPETHEHYQVCLRCNAYRGGGVRLTPVGGEWAAAPAESSASRPRL